MAIGPGQDRRLQEEYRKAMDAAHATPGVEDDNAVQEAAIGGQYGPNLAADIQNNIDGKEGNHGTYLDPNAPNRVVPGSATVGGSEGEGADLKASALMGEANNDAMQHSNDAAMGRSIANMMGNRGTMSPENQQMVAREAAARAQQGKALDLSRQAAMGLAPSAAAGQTRQGMNDLMAGQAGAMGAARGLSALSGAQSVGGAGLGMSMTAMASQGGMARSKEMADNLGQYGMAANNMRSGDIGRLVQSDQNASANADLNANWKIGNANLANQQGALGNSMGAADDVWYDASTKPADVQLKNDQEMQAIVAGANAGEASARLERANESAANRRQMVGGMIQGGLTAAGGAVGGPVGAAAGAGAGGMFNSYINK